jgi:short-subunit dehydrogenase
MKRDLRGKRILITGASGGIGRSLAEHAGARGASVVLAARNAERISQLAQTLRTRGVDAFAVRTDVTSETDRRRLLGQTADRLGGLDILINNAGVASFGHFASSSEVILREIMEVNFCGPAELIRAAIPLLSEGKQPAIVNVSSMCGRRAMPAWSEYSASKCALTGLTEALKAEMARFDIDVLLVLPGMTRGEFPEHLLADHGRMHIGFERGMSPDEVADGILHALERKRSEVVLGRDARWLLRFQRFFPRLLDRLICRRVTKLYEKPQAAEAAIR